jgi:toxin ParE1/3/4
MLPVAEPRFTPKARQDPDDIWDFTVEHWGTAQADRYVVTIVGVCRDLAAGRLFGRDAGTVREGYLTYRTGAHIVFFRRVDDGGDGIEIVRILHERMGPSVTSGNPQALHLDIDRATRRKATAQRHASRRAG